MKLKVFLLVLLALALNAGVVSAQSDDETDLYTATVIPCPSDIFNNWTLATSRDTKVPVG